VIPTIQQCLARVNELDERLLAQQELLHRCQLEADREALSEQRPLSKWAPYRVRMFWAVVVLASTKPQGHRPAKTSRIELRATEDDRDLLVRAAAALGTDRSSFLLTQGLLAALGEQEGERINSRPARRLPGLARLLERPSPLAMPEADQPQA